MHGISEKEYKKVLSFIDDMSICGTNNLERQVLYLFDKYFGFQTSSFWTYSDNSKLNNSFALNIDKLVIADYLNNYCDMDFLTLQNVPQIISRQSVFYNLDLVTSEQYEKSDFYQGFMSKYGYYYNMVVFLYDGIKIWGLIDFVRSKEDKPFNNLEGKSLEIIGKFITQKVREKHLISNLLTPFSRSSAATDILQSLTTKEKAVLELAKQGYTNTEIASKLFISINTVKKHMQQLYRKFNVTNRTSLCHKFLTYNN